MCLIIQFEAAGIEVETTSILCLTPTVFLHNDDIKQALFFLLRSKLLSLPVFTASATPSSISLRISSAVIYVGEPSPIRVKYSRFSLNFSSSLSSAAFCRDIFMENNSKRRANRINRLICCLCSNQTALIILINAKNLYFFSIFLIIIEI